MPKTTASKNTDRRNRSREKNRRRRSQKAERRKSRKNSPLPTNQRTHLRNESEFSSKHFLGEYSDKGLPAQALPLRLLRYDHVLKQVCDGLSTSLEAEVFWQQSVILNLATPDNDSA